MAETQANNLGLAIRPLYSALNFEGVISLYVRHSYPHLKQGVKIGYKRAVTYAYADGRR